MKKYLLVIGIAVVIGFASCGQNNSKAEEHDAHEHDGDAATEAVQKMADKTSEGYQLMKQKCFACHNPDTESHDAIIAPPMIAVKMHYNKRFETKEAFVDAFVKWSQDPKEENAIMKGAVKKFQVMPKQIFDKEDLTKIATYVYENDIDQPDWFDQHLKEDHGGGLGMGSNGMGWMKNMSLNDGEKWEANKETTDGVANMLKLLEETGASTTEAYQKNGTLLKEHIDLVLNQCTMKGESHDQLHTFLVPLISKVDKLKSANMDEQGAKIQGKIKEHLEVYDTYFK